MELKKGPQSFNIRKRIWHFCYSFFSLFFIYPSAKVHTSRHLLFAHLKTSEAPQPLEVGPMLCQHFFLKITSRITPRYLPDRLWNTLYNTRNRNATGHLNLMRTSAVIDMKLLSHLFYFLLNGSLALDFTTLPFILSCFAVSLIIIIITDPKDTVHCSASSPLQFSSVSQYCKTRIQNFFG
jgi:hypothetical protein